MGAGTVRVTRHGDGARCDVAERSDTGADVHAAIDRSAFQRTEGASR